MVILGVDPGLRATGYGLIEVDDAAPARIVLLETGTIRPRPKDPLPDRIGTIFADLDQIIVQFRPQVMVLEKLYAHYKHPATAAVIGHARGAICLAGARRGLPVAEHSVKRVRKSLVGQGNATKEQSRQVVARLLGIAAGSLPLDASDALALAIGYSRMHRTGTVPVPGRKEGRNDDRAVDRAIEGKA